MFNDLKSKSCKFTEINTLMVTISKNHEFVLKIIKRVLVLAEVGMLGKVYHFYRPISHNA